MEQRSRDAARTDAATKPSKEVSVLGMGQRVCVRHGAKLKRCSREGCTNIALRGGVCWRHGAKEGVKAKKKGSK